MKVVCEAMLALRDDLVGWTWDDFIEDAVRVLAALDAMPELSGDSANDGDAPALDLAGSDYVCIQCGPDPRGSAEHAWYRHTMDGLGGEPFRGGVTTDPPRPTADCAGEDHACYRCHDPAVSAGTCWVCDPDIEGDERCDMHKVSADHSFVSRYGNGSFCGRCEKAAWRHARPVSAGGQDSADPRCAYGPCPLHPIEGSTYCGRHHLGAGVPATPANDAGCERAALRTPPQVCQRGNDVCPPCQRRWLDESSAPANDSAQP